MTTPALRFTTSWDDGHPLDLRLAELLATHGFSGTFYVPRGNREGRPVMTTAELRALTERMAGKQGALDALLGEDDAKKATQAIDRANALLASLGNASQRLDAMIAKADARVLGQGGLIDGAQQAVGQMNAALGEVRDNLKRVEKILSDAEAVSGNAKAATADLAALRAEVDASLRKVSSLIDEINRKWPFQRDSEIRLP